VPHKNISKKLKLRLKNTIIDKMLTYASETWILTRRGRKQINIFERKVYRRILGCVYDNEKKLEDIHHYIYLCNFKKKTHYNRDCQVK
jgi:hypothetical protein